MRKKLIEHANRMRTRTEARRSDFKRKLALARYMVQRENGQGARGFQPVSTVRVWAYLEAEQEWQNKEDG